MTRLQAALIAIAVAAALPAAAAVEPPPGPMDSRVRSTPFNPMQVVIATSTNLIPLQFVFDQGETTITIAGMLVQPYNDKGEAPTDAKDWLARRSGNTLTLQPLREMDPSMMFVRTKTEDGQERPYTFELRTRPGSMTDGKDKAAYTMIQFMYKKPPSPEAVAAWRARQESAAAAATEKAVKVKFEQADAGRTRNYDYEKHGSGCPVLAPAFIYDDGNRTTMLFTPHATLPAVYRLNQDNKPALAMTINETLSTGLQMTLPSVEREIWLARGSKLVCGFRPKVFDSRGEQPGGGSGTVSPHVIRQVRTP